MGGGALLVEGILLLEPIKHADLDLARVAVLLDRADDLDRDVLPRLQVARLDDLAERALAQQSHDLICTPRITPSVILRVKEERRGRERTALVYEITLPNDVVALLVIACLVIPINIINIYITTHKGVPRQRAEQPPRHSRSNYDYYYDSAPSP